MAVRFETFPDAEAVAGHALRSAAIAGVGDSVYSSLPKTPTFPLILVKRIGGVPAERHHLDRARLQVEAWGVSKSEALDAAQAARAALHEMEGQTYSTEDGAPVDAFVTGVEDDLGLAWLPDPPTNGDRYIFGVAVLLHG